MNNHELIFLMESINQEIKSLIDKYLNGKLSDAECLELEGWIREKAENRFYFQNYCRQWTPKVSAEIEKSWKSFSAGLRVYELNANRRSKEGQPWAARIIRMTNRQFTRYAAILVIGLVISFLGLDQLKKISFEKTDSSWISAQTLAGQKSKIILPDSTVVWMNSETSISFQSDFEKRKNRIVKLDGEAFFDVSDQGNSKFIVRSNDYDVHVKGTQFNVMAYKDFNRTETTLVEGAVTIVKGNNELNILPGERVIFANNYLTKSKAQVRQAILWKDNKFYFDNIPFRELVRRLERWYDVNISLNDPSLYDIYYSGYFKNEETVWQVLDVIQMTTPVKYERKEHREIAIDLK